MEIKTIVTGIVQTNTYIAVDEENETAVIIDPAEEYDYIITELDSLKVKLKGILITHGHFDHIGAVNQIVKEYHVPVYAHKNEAEMMKDSRENLSVYLIQQSIVADADHFVEHGDIIHLGGQLVFKCLEVPGHTANSICYYNEAYDVLFTGDTLMTGTIGRTDFYLNDSQMLIDNINDKLMTLPDKTRVYPGHGHSTKIITEKERNPYF